MALVGSALVLVAMGRVEREPVRLFPTGNTSSLAEEAGSEGLYHNLVRTCSYDNSFMRHQDDQHIKTHSQHLYDTPTYLRSPPACKLLISLLSLES